MNPYIYRTTSLSLSLSLSLSPRASVYIEGSKFSPFIYRAKKTARKRRGRPRGWGGRDPRGNGPCGPPGTRWTPLTPPERANDMERAESLYAALGAKQGISRKTRRTGRGERRAGRQKRRPRRKSRQNRRRPPGPAGGRATGGPEGLKARGQPRRPRRKPPGRSPRPGEKDPAQTGRGRRGRTPATPQAGAGARTGKRTKTGGGRRRREKTEMRQRTQGEIAGPCAWRYSCQVASVNVRAGPNAPVRTPRSTRRKGGWGHQDGAPLAALAEDLDDQQAEAGRLQRQPEQPSLVPGLHQLVDQGGGRADPPPAFPAGRRPGPAPGPRGSCRRRWRLRR